MVILPKINITRKYIAKLIADVDSTKNMNRKRGNLDKRYNSKPQ